MLSRRLLAVAALATLAQLQAQTALDTAHPLKPIRVLFIGNSYTYGNNLPKLVEAVAAAEKTGPPIETEAVLKGGQSLKGHWEEGNAVEAIRKGGWDIVCLQEHSTLGNPPPPGEKPVIADPAAYFEYANKFAAEIVAAGARPILYATWAREDHPEQQRRLDDAFVRVARQIDAAIVPVGLAWTIVRIEAPDIRLYTPDRSHPTAAGSYLAALLFYQTITGRAPVSAPAVISGTSWNSAESVRLVNLTLSDALSLRMFAARAWEQEPLHQLTAR